MPQNQRPQNDKQVIAVTGKNKRSKKRTAGRVALWIGFIVLTCLALFLLINALLSVFVPHYYPTFGDKRLFSVVTDSMEPEIPTGSMIVSRRPADSDEIAVGTVITFEVKTGDNITLLTHRVIAVNTDDAGRVSYTTRGDNADGEDPVRPGYDDVVGIYTGSKCGVIGYIFGFLQSPEGAIALILIVAIGAMAYIVVRLVNIINMWRTVAADALKTSESLLAGTENDGLGVIADVIGIAVKEPRDKKEARRKDKKLRWFMKTGTLPKRPYDDDLNVDAEMNSANDIANEEGKPIEIAPSPETSAPSTEVSENPTNADK